MFTLRKRPMVPFFSTVSGNPKEAVGPEAPKVAHTDCGSMVQEEIDKLESYRPEYIGLIKTVIMPDHAHILLRVRQRLERPVTSYVGATMSAITSRLRKSGMIPMGESCFEEGITDSIVRGNGHYDILYSYICDNPRRLLMKRQYPDLFRRRLSITIGEVAYDAVGNMFLLRRPLVAVHVRRAWSKEEIEKYHAECCGKAENGYVLISPFIHPGEKAIMKEVIEAGGSVIKLSDRGFGERWKPTGRAFDLCAAGRLLCLAEAGSSEMKTEMRYAKASRMNRLAEAMADIGPVQMKISGNSLKK